VVVSRAVTVAVLGIGVTVVYIAIVAGIGAFVGTGERLWTSVAATAVIAVGFDPVRRRVLAAATRLVTGIPSSPYEVLAQLSDRLARADSTDDVLDRVVTLLVEATGATRAEVHAVGEAGQYMAAVAGDAGTAAVVRSVPVAHEGERLGEIRLLADRDDRILPADERLVHQVAATLGPVLRNVRLTRELHDRIQELRASRERLVTAHDDARRAVERDIHDGAQQHLLSVRLKLGVASTHAEHAGAAELLQLLDDTASEVDESIRQLRDLAQGLYPTLLAEQGLGPALRAQARHVPVPVDVRTDGVGRLDRTIEAAVYFCCLEAMQNASRYATASSMCIEVAHADGRLDFSVADDGVGFDTAAVHRGTGLANMADRIAGLGGSVQIESVPGHGTTVRGQVPVGPTGQPDVSDR
jgi:two-component system, NarL family, sensor kinase